MNYLGYSATIVYQCEKDIGIRTSDVAAAAMFSSHMTKSFTVLLYII